MINRDLPKKMADKLGMQRGRKLSLRTVSAWVGLSLGAVVLAIAVLYFVFGGAFLNGYGKEKVERAFAKAHPGHVLRIGELTYELVANRLVAQSVTLSATNITLKVGQISLTGVGWGRLLWGKAALADVFNQASLDATNLDLEFPQSYYGIRCARLRASVPGSELIAEVTELRSLVGDEELFAMHDVRTTRYHVLVPECRVLGLAFGELIEAKSYRAGSMDVYAPSFDALVNRDKPTDPFAETPLMVNEALAAIPQHVQLDRLNITNGHITYCERVVAGSDPGVLTFAAVNITAEGIANRGEVSSAILLRAQGNLMNAGLLKVQMTIPVVSPDLSLHYSGSLGAMDLTRLGPFLDVAERIMIKSGNAHEVTFEIDVTGGEARGRLQANYDDLVMAVLDSETATEEGLDNRIASFLLNALKIRKSNAPDASGAMKEGEINYTRKSSDTFLQFAWFALRSGVLDVISQ